MTKRILLAAVLGLALSSAVQAAEDSRLQTELDGLSKAWAHVNYEIRDMHAETAEAQRLGAQAGALAARYPGRAEPLAWQALMLLCEADARHDLKSLELTRAAKNLLERAARIDPNALGPGTIYANLGSLYTQLPGFPLSFGDRGKARGYFDKALAASPNGLDANYFYADYLNREGRRTEAMHALEKALAAPDRPGRELADRGRKWEAMQLLTKIQRKEKDVDGRAEQPSRPAPKPGRRGN